MRRLSSWDTEFQKYLLMPGCLLWFAVAFLRDPRAFLNAPILSVLLLSFLCVLAHSMIRLKIVHLVGSSALIVSSFGTKVPIPLSAVRRVRASGFFGFVSVSITLRERKSVGRKFFFTVRHSWGRASKNPTVQELRALVAAATNGAA
jgi:hypothetical protein